MSCQTLDHNCGVLLMGCKAVDSVFYKMKEPSTEVATVLLAGWQKIGKLNPSAKLKMFAIEEVFRLWSLLGSVAKSQL